MTDPITADMALGALEDVVRETPDGAYFQYHAPISDSGSCVYTYLGEPSCIVGHALVRLGVPLSDLARLDSPAIEAELLPHYLSFVTREAAHVFDAAQSVQDNGAPWGEAVEAARYRFANLEDEKTDSGGDV